MDRILDSAAVAAVAGLLVLPLTFAASGSLGSWGPLGPDPLLVSGALVAELFVGCLISSAVLHLLSGRAVTAWRLPASWSPKAAGRL